MTIIDEQPDTGAPDAPFGGAPGAHGEAGAPGGPQRFGTRSVVGADDFRGMVLSRFTKGDDKILAARRSQFPITAFVGLNGNGKTLAMVHDIIPALDAGRLVLSTVRILDYNDPRPCPGGSRCDDPANHEVVLYENRPVADDVTQWESVPIPTGRIHAAAHKNYRRLQTYDQLMRFQGGEILLDEVTGIASSREHASLPHPVAQKLLQLRKSDCSLRWTTPNWARADKIIREMTGLVTVSVGGAKVRASDETGLKRWRDSRHFYFSSYDASVFDEFQVGKRDKLQRSVYQRFWRPGSLTELAYETRGAVNVLGYDIPTGTCIHDGLKIKTKYCSSDGIH